MLLSFRRTTKTGLLSDNCQQNRAKSNGWVGGGGGGGGGFIIHDNLLKTMSTRLSSLLYIALLSPLVIDRGHFENPHFGYYFVALYILSKCVWQIQLELRVQVGAHPSW